MVLVNSLYVLPRHSGNIRIIIFDNYQAQEILKLNKKDFNTVHNITNIARHYGFMYTSTDKDSIKKWYLKTTNNSYHEVFHYNKIFSTTYYLSELDHFWTCPKCLSAVPSTWTKCSCKSLWT